MVLLIIDVAQRANATVGIETLVDDELQRASNFFPAESDREEARHCAVVGYRLHIVCSRMVMSTLCSLLTAHFQVDINPDTSRRRRASHRVNPADLDPGDYCVNPARIKTLDMARRIIAEWAGALKDNLVEFDKPIILDVDAVEEAQEDNAEDEPGVVVSQAGAFNAASFEEEDPDDVAVDVSLSDEDASASIPLPPVDDCDGITVDLPENHLFGPLQAQTAMKSRFNKMKYEQWNLPECQRDPANYMTEVDGKVLFTIPDEVRENNLYRALVDKVNFLALSALPDYNAPLVDQAEYIRRRMMEAGICLDTSEMTSEQLEDVMKDHIIDPADIAPIEAQREDEFGDSDREVVDSFFRALASARRKTEIIRQAYFLNNQPHALIEQYAPRVMKTLFRDPSQAGVPGVYYAVEREYESIMKKIGPKHKSAASQKAFEYLTRTNEYMCRRMNKRYGLDSFLMADRADMFTEGCQLTQSQAAICMFHAGSFGRAAMLSTQYPAVFMVAVSKAGVGKSVALKTSKACTPKAAISKSNGTTSGQGSTHRMSVLLHTFMDELEGSLHPSSFATRKTALADGVIEHSRQQQTASGVWTPTDFRFLKLEAIAGNANDTLAEKDRALQDRAIIFHPGQTRAGYSEHNATLNAVSRPRRKDEKTAVTTVQRLVRALTYSFWKTHAAGFFQPTTAMYDVLIALARTKLGSLFQKRFRVRAMAHIEALSVALMAERVSSAWLQHVRHTMPSTAKLDVEFIRYIVASSWVTDTDALRAMWRVMELTGTNEVFDEVVAAIRSNVAFDAQGPVRGRSETGCDNRYFMTTLTPFDYGGVQAMLPSQHGLSVVKQTMVDMRHSQHKGTTILKYPLKKYVTVLASYVLRPEVRTGLTNTIWASLRHIFENDPSDWDLDYDTESFVCFSRDVLNMFENQAVVQRDLPPQLESIDQDTLHRELTMMAMSGVCSFKTDYHAGGDWLQVRVGRIHEVSSMESSQIPASWQDPLPDGGILTVAPANGTYKKEKRMGIGVLKVPLDALLQVTASSTQSPIEAEIRSISELALILGGSHRPGDAFVEGLQCKRGIGLNEVPITATMLDKHKTIRVQNNNADRHASGCFKHTTLTMRVENMTSPSMSDDLLPREYAEVEFNPAAHTPLYQIVQDAHCKRYLGCDAPYHLHYDVMYSVVARIKVTYEEYEISFCVGKRRDEPEHVIPAAVGYLNCELPADKQIKDVDGAMMMTSDTMEPYVAGMLFEESIKTYEAVRTFVVYNDQTSIVDTPLRQKREMPSQSSEEDNNSDRDIISPEINERRSKIMKRRRVMQRLSESVTDQESSDEE
ncbi:MAG: hypothetical protein CL678_17595 [Bdellovibrionaceae bacterium]|nr:hypothetical protein [Pseudobdellovibrionaceae bacterium]